MNKLVKEQLKKVVKEEIVKMLEEAKKKQPTICEKLEKLREKLIPEMVMDEDTGGNSAGSRRMERRVQVQTVSELLEIPINEITLYFINEIKNSNHRHLIEMRLGHVYFYAGTSPNS